ncbi:SCO family protein [Hahella sp. HN01]|uniref:SCO family protein n=1 Tax=Hahella sp. HN01 TaxID=2847262 RepID=UPI001C1E9F9C|nr:SCO family protein [Hahella sp. HN01]
MTAIRLVFIAIVLALTSACSQEPVEWSGTDISGMLPELKFSLQSENAAPVSEQDFTGKYNILFFGYTYCPDICPTTLARLKSALSKLEAAEQQRINILFVSVDPKRDAPEQLKAYTDAFGSEFIGLTGDMDALQTLTKRYRVAFGYGKPDETGAYEVSHSSAAFVFDADGKARLLLRDDLSADMIAKDLDQLLKS